MKRCPVCNARCFDDMKMCFGCLFRFEDEDGTMEDAMEDVLEDVPETVPEDDSKDARETASKDAPEDDFAAPDSAAACGVVRSFDRFRASDSQEGDAAGNIGTMWKSVAKSSRVPADGAACISRKGTDMLLAVDVGNTQTVIGLLKGMSIEARWRISTVKAQTADELSVVLRGLFLAADIHPEGIAGSALASVVPRLTGEWQKVLADATDAEPVVCTAASADGLFKADYPNPQEIGQDRVADAIALRTIYGAPSIVVDFGTATNIEVIDSEGRFIGGIIAPGVETSMAALFLNASRLSMVDLEDPGCVVGKNTAQAIQSGIVYGEAERVDGLLRRIYEELGEKPAVVATGGLASMMAKHSREISAVDADLTLKGLAILYRSCKIS